MPIAFGKESDRTVAGGLYEKVCGNFRIYPSLFHSMRCLARPIQVKAKLFFPSPFTSNLHLVVLYADMPIEQKRWSRNNWVKAKRNSGFTLLRVDIQRIGQKRWRQWSRSRTNFTSIFRRDLVRLSWITTAFQQNIIIFVYVFTYCLTY